MTKKKPEPNPIEEAIGDRAKPKNDLREKVKEILSEIPDEPSPQEMLSLEELNRRTEERLLELGTETPLTPDVWPANLPLPKKTTIPVSKPDLQPVTETSSQESPPQGKFEKQIANDGDTPQTRWVCPDCSEIITGPSYPKLHECHGAIDNQKHVERYNKTAEKIGIPKIAAEKTPTLDGVIEANRKQNEINERTLPPAEDIELTALRKYILEDGFPVSAVAFHIVTLCSEPLVVTSTTTWDFRDRANIPEMVFALLHQPGYIEGVWPSLKIIMGSNAGNPAWSAGVLMTIALFDVIRTLPALKELKDLENDS